MKLNKNLNKANEADSQDALKELNPRRVYFELPSIEIFYCKKDYPWHLQTVVEFDFDQEKIENLQKEIKLQLQIGQEIARILNLEGLKHIKAGAYIRKGTIVHDFYVDRHLKKPTLRSTAILMGIVGYRSVSFDLVLDKEWENAKPYFDLFGCDNLELLKEKLLKLDSPLSVVK